MPGVLVSAHGESGLFPAIDLVRVSSVRLVVSWLYKFAPMDGVVSR